jgi:flavin reductase (DIM6/NTAB) family NADH-FMN oxidoreductase RutF
MNRRTGLLPGVAVPFRKIARMFSRCGTTPVGNQPASGVDGPAFRHAMGQFATGVTVIACDSPDGPHCMTANAVTSVSLDPPLLLICVGQEARLLRHLVPEQRFTVNVLANDQESLARYFSRTLPEDVPLPGYNIDRVHDAPSLAGCITTLVCDVQHRYQGGDHQIVLGHVRAICSPGLNRSPLLFHRGEYASLHGTDDRQHLATHSAQRSGRSAGAAMAGIQPLIALD